MSEESSFDSVADCYNEWSLNRFSKKLGHVRIGQKSTNQRRSKRHLLQKLFTRQIRGCLARHSYASEEKLFETIPPWRQLPLANVVPKSALEAGHTVMGLTQCGQFLLTYTCSLDVSGDFSLYKYLLHWWAFRPNRVVRKVAEVSLFGNYNIWREVSIVISQWPMERNKLVIYGLCSNFSHALSTDRAYMTITTVPSLENCRDCMRVAASYGEEELAANWDSCVRCNCLQHGLTVHTTYEVIPPHPIFRAEICLNYSNHVVVNTGNFLHVLRVDMNVPRTRNSKSEDKHESINDIGPLDVSDLEDPDDKVESYEILDEKIGTPDCTSDRSPKCDSMEDNAKYDEHSPLNTCSGNQSDGVCDISKSNCTLSVKVCDCIDNSECKCDSMNYNNSKREQQGISLRDKILQDFCEDISQELSIGESITLVKHPSCSPRSTPQRLPSDLRTLTWPLSILTPPSDILRTRNSESSQRTTTRRQRSDSPQPGASRDNTSLNVSSINSHRINASSSCPSPRLMSPPITKPFRHHSPLKRSNLHSPTPATHKLILEAEKAYEFTDEAQETCEKLSSFRKRRLADKKYEFCDETEDAENIVPFKHMRDQAKHRCSSIPRITSPTSSPISNGKRHRLDSEHSESDDLNSSQDGSIYMDFTSIDMAEKTVLRPLNQNQLTNGGPHRDRSGKNGPSVSPLVPKVTLQHPRIKCTAHFKRSYIELDDEMISVITDVEDEETGGYVSYQCVLPMQVHGSGYTQMQMISNSKAEKLALPYVCVNQMSFDIETFSHHIADWICTRFKKKYWHCTDYDIEIIDVCALSGDIICLLVLNIQASELSSHQSQCSQDRKQYEAGCKFTWNMDTNLYRITDVLPIVEWNPKTSTSSNSTCLWNPTKFMAPRMRQAIRQPYARTVRYVGNQLSLAGESITRLRDLDNLVEFYLTPKLDDSLLD